MKKIKTCIIFLICSLLINNFQLKAFAINNAFDADAVQKLGFTLIKKQFIDDKKATAYYLKHKKSGAGVFYLDDGKEEKAFSIGFRTPPADNKGGNHVLEHCLMCGSKKYPSKNISHYLRGNSVANIINAFTFDDSTSYVFKTSNKTDFYNLADVYINAALNPSILTDENIFKQQGIRKEYSDGKVLYNGVVYNELRLKSLESKYSTLNFVASEMYKNLFGNTVPAFNSGGYKDTITGLTYSDVLQVYQKYYTPSNSIICTSGNQDILQTLDLLNSYLKNYDNEAPNITWNYSPAKPINPIKNYNITNKTNTVDIGFLYSGPAVTDIKEFYAYEVLINIIRKNISTSYSKNYYIPAITGGISNYGIIISGITLSEKDKAISYYNTILNSLKQDGISITELNSAIEEVESIKSNYDVAESSDLVLDGFVYGDNPFMFLDQESIFKYFKDNPSYFKGILEQYFINNPYKSIVVSGNVTKDENSNEIKVLEKELVEIKKETEAFNAWAEAPDTPDILAKIPVLSLEDFREGRFNEKADQIQKLETLNGVNYYATLDDSVKKANAYMYFKLPEFNEELEYGVLLIRYLNYKFASIGLNNVSCSLAPCENFLDENVINPRFTISVSYDKEAIEVTTKKVFELLNDNGLFSSKELGEFLEQENNKSKILSSNPYQIAYDMMMSSQSKYNKFWTATRDNGSIFYFKFIKEALRTPEENVKRANILNNILKSTINRNDLIISYNGNSTVYNFFKLAFDSCVKHMSGEPRATYSKELKSGYNSAIILSDKQDVSEIRQVGNIHKSSYKYSGKMDVLGNLLTSRYLNPILRGKMGAYGAKVSFTNSDVIFSAVGVDEIDKGLKVFAGAGDYLRNLSITQKELDSIIASTLSSFDEYYNADNYSFEQEPLNHCTLDDWKNIRQDILNTTVEDIKNYANFIDEVINQKSVFVIANSKRTPKTSFSFQCTVDSSDFTITSYSNKNNQ